MAINEMIERPSLYDVYNFLTLDVVREDQVKMSLFTNWLLSSKCVLLEGASSSGKTTVMDAVAKIIGEKCFKIAGSSDTAPYYMYEKINEASHIYIPELNKVNDTVVEILKDWGEGKASKRDVTVKKGGHFETEEFKVFQKPFIFARADENPIVIPDELLNRVTVMVCDPSMGQTNAVLDRQAEMAERPMTWAKGYETPKFVDLEYHIRTLPIFKHYIHPAAGYFKDIMPIIFPTARRDFPRYLINTYGITRFHHHERVNRKVPTVGTVSMVAPYDMWANHIIYGEILLASSLRCTKNEELVLSVVAQHEPIGYSDIQKYLSAQEYNLTLGTVKRHVKSLQEAGYLYWGKDGNKNVFFVSPELGNFEAKIVWSNVHGYIMENITTQVSEDMVDEYCELFMDNKWEFQHPFTGEIIDVLETTDVIKLADIIEFKGSRTTKVDIYTQKEEPKVKKTLEEYK